MDHNRLRKLTEHTNRIVLEEVPRLRNQVAEIESTRKVKSDELDRLFDSTRLLDKGSVKAILESKGEKLAREIEELDRQIQLKESEIQKENTQKVDFQMVREVLRNFTAVFSELTPHEQQQVVHHLVDHVVYGESEVRIALDTGVYIEPIRKGSHKVFSGTPNQRGGRGSHRTLMVVQFSKESNILAC